MTLLEKVLSRLEQHYAEDGKAELFKRLKPFLVEGGRGKPYAEVGTELGVSEVFESVKGRPAGLLKKSCRLSERRKVALILRCQRVSKGSRSLANWTA